jgi:hypothetical protein
MNYKIIYNTIIEKAKKENRKKLNKNNFIYIYYENHHILPKCLGGDNSKENLVLLTAKEHYVCHKLLTYIYKGNKKLGDAFHRMTFDKMGKHRISSRDYAYARELKSFIPISEETKLKMKNNRPNINGKNNPMFGKKHLKETKELIRKSRINKKALETIKQKMKQNHKGMEGKHHSKETIQNMRIIKIGEFNPMFGRKHSEESRNKMKKDKIIRYESEISQ